MDRQFAIDQMIELFPGTTRGSWAQLRFSGRGPKFTKVGKRVFYAERDVVQFLEAGARTNTGDAA